MVSRAVPEGLTDRTALLCAVWTPMSLYWGRISWTLHAGSQTLQPGAALSTKPLGPPISCLFRTAMARRRLDRGLSHTSKLSTCGANQTIELGADHSKLRVGAAHLPREAALLPQRILVDGNDVSVLQQLFWARADVSKIIRHQQRCSHDGPQRHLRLLLVGTQAKVSNHQLERTVGENTRAF